MKMSVMKSAAVCAALVTAGGWFEAQGGEAVTLSLSVSDKGIGIGAGNMGTFTLTYPTLKAEGDAKLKPVETRVEGGKAALRYANGGKIDVAAGDGKVALTFAGMPASVQSFTVAMSIPFNYKEGGSWKIGSAGAPFPAEKPAKPHLYQGNATDFALTSVDNKHLSLAVPSYSYQQLTDNREWNNNQTFTWSAFVPYNRDHKTETIAVSLDASAAQRVVLVDKFGQTTRKDFPGKIKDEAEFKAGIAADEAYFASFTPPVRDRFGGLPDSGAKLGLKKTGFFHVEQKGERWILVNPDGNAFFHLGICSFGPGDDYTYVEGRHDIYEWLPPRQGEFAAAWHPQPYWNPLAFSFYKANVIRKYGAPFDDAAQTIRMVDRVRQVGFNSIGAFSGGSKAAADKGFPRVSTLPLGQSSIGGVVPGLRGVFDPFEPEVLAKMDDQFAKALAPQADDPLMIGFYLANEQGF